jgi:putative transposase
MKVRSIMSSTGESIVVTSSRHRARPKRSTIEGMHWLQSTFGTRFNRFRSERGYLFQGRYQALLVEDDAALLHLINYVHLNPLRAGEVGLEQLRTFRWSSLGALLASPSPSWLVADRLLRQLNLCDSTAGWTHYLTYLLEIAGNPGEQESQEFDQMSSGWAIGTQTWKHALARKTLHSRSKSAGTQTRFTTSKRRGGGAHSKRRWLSLIK